MRYRTFPIELMLTLLIALSPLATAQNTIPANNAKEQRTSVALSWNLEGKTQAKFGYLLFIGTSSSAVEEAFYRNHPTVKVHILETSTQTLTGLKPGTTYYWRVDTKLTQDDTEPPKGTVNSFTTSKSTQPSVVQTGFDSDRDFLKNHVGDSIWDGLIGRHPRETADQIKSRDGTLVLQSTRGRYQEGWNPLGPLLYRIVTTDFKATVKIADYQSTSFNNGGIMARAATLNDAGKGEDWISIDYFPIYAGIYGRMADNNRRSEKTNNGQGKNADRFLQLERIGNLFYLRHSPDGVAWTDLPNTPITRNDLVNVPLQVGLFQATYSDNQGAVEFDDFKLELGKDIKNARIHSPVDGSKGTPNSVTLTWIPGSGAKKHQIYFGSSLKDVESASLSSPKGCFRGEQDVDLISYSVDNLKGGAPYFWRIDEVTDGETHKGEVWSFSVYDRVIARFDRSKTNKPLSEQWVPSLRAKVEYSEEHPLRGDGSLSYHYDLDSQDSSATEIKHEFSQNQDWLTSRFSFRSLRIHFRGNPENSPGELYLTLEDNDWGSSKATVVYRGENRALTKPEWTQWNLDLRDILKDNPSFRLDQVKSMTLGVQRVRGARTPLKGTILIDEISVEYKDPSPGAKEWPRYIQPNQFVTPVPFKDVKVTGGIWKERMEVNRKVSLPHVWSRCENSTKANGDESTRLDNFRKVAGEISNKDFTGIYFNDSDVYKIIEGTANSLQNHPDPELEAYTDQVINSIAKAQWEDGYLFTFYSLPKRRPEARWSNIGSMHELYCAGHLFEAAIAYHKATGKRQLLDVAIKFADLISETFAPGKRTNPPGHQEIELALVKLYQHTGTKRYLETAKFFIDQRGNGTERNLYGTYSQDHLPFTQQEKGVGHSVRAGYLYCAATDVAAITGNEAYANSLFRLWDNITNTKTYLTGGIGQPGGPEGFANDYELGNSCYSETCSGIAFGMWNHRLHQLTGDTKHIDLLERTFLNNVLSSLSVKGDRHYYTNPLTTNGRERWEWPGHDCACCPSSLVRTISSISGYTYTHRDKEINVNVFMPSEATISLPDNEVTLVQSTDYPWDGMVNLKVTPQKSERFTINLRVPGWARNQPMPGNLYRYLKPTTQKISLTINGRTLTQDFEQGYIKLKRQWKPGDTITLSLPMPVRRVIAHPKAVANKGRVAIERGPIVYCAEFKDNTVSPDQLIITDGMTFSPSLEKEFLTGAVTLTSDTEPRIKLIPYYLYANRGPGWMRVWHRRQ